jgi:hypothetical protein
MTQGGEVKDANMAAVEVTESRRISSRVWRLWFAAIGAGKSYYVWRDRTLISKSIRNWIDIDVGGEGEVTVEVFDAATDLPGPCYPGRVFLQWEQVAEAGSYRIYELVDEAWVLRGAVAEYGKWIYTWESGVLEDVTEHRFKISAVVDERETDVKEFGFFVVRVPDWPKVTYSVDPETLELTVA